MGYCQICDNHNDGFTKKGEELYAGRCNLCGEMFGTRNKHFWSREPLP